jgi:hypothetical protein
VSLAWSQAALAARVIVLSPNGHTRRVNDRFVPSHLSWGLDTASRTSAGPAATARSGLTVPRRLVQLKRDGAITLSQQRKYSRAWSSSLRAGKRLRGARKSELEAVIDNLRAITAEHLLTASRLPALFLTLSRNLRWWTTGPLLSYGQRVQFTGSRLVWEFYPGQGIQLQVLGSFGEADGLYAAGKSHYGQLESLLGELIPLAVHRGGGLAWEYYFDFDGGRSPWVSAMAEGTALEALTRAYKATGNPTYLTLAHQALGILRDRPGTGVAVTEPRGTRFLQYSFAPHLDIINAFLQTLIGLYDYAQTSGDPMAEQLFASGNAEAMAEVPHFDTGAWSLYQPGLEDDLSYHKLVTGFLQQLCSRTGTSVYCQAAQHFQSYLHTRPVIQQRTARATARRGFGLGFRLSKASRVGVVLIRGTRTLLATSAQFPHGTHSFSVGPLRRGTYSVHLSATDLAGNFSREVGSLVVKPRRKR